MEIGGHLTKIFAWHAVTYAIWSYADAEGPRDTFYHS